MRSRTVYVLLAGLALTPLVSGCGGGSSPEARARQTATVLDGTRTPTPLESARTSVAQGTFTGIDPESAASLTAEGFLPITSGVLRSMRTPEPRNVATHIAENVPD